MSISITTYEKLSMYHLFAATYFSRNAYYIEKTKMIISLMNIEQT